MPLDHCHFTFIECFFLQYAILVTIIFTVFFKYILHSIDLQSENPWENKVLYMLYIEIVTGKDAFFVIYLIIIKFVSIQKIYTAAFDNYFVDSFCCLIIAC